MKRPRIDCARGALWANDLGRVRQPEIGGGEYVLVEVGTDRLVSPLAWAMGREEPEVLRRLERGCRVFVAWSWRDEVVSWLWVTTSDEYAPQLGLTLRVADGDCYGFGAETLEGHRGRGLFTGLLEHAGWQMARDGCRTMWNGIADANLASRRAHVTAGFRPVVRLLAIYEPASTRLRSWPAYYADPRLVERAGRMLGPAPKLAEVLA